MFAHFATTDQWITTLETYFFSINHLQMPLENQTSYFTQYHSLSLPIIIYHPFSQVHACHLHILSGHVHDTTTSPLFTTFLTCILSWLLLQSEDISYVVYSIFPLAIPLSVVVSFLRHTSHKFRFTNHVIVWFPKFRRTSQRNTTCCVIYSSKEFAKSCQLGVQWWGWTCKEQKFRWIWCHVIGVDLFGAQNSCGPGITWWGLTLSNKSLCGPE